MNKPTVLIVDDERNTREGLAKAFSHKYRVLLAENADRGMEIVRSSMVDIVLTDLRMPGMDGLTFIRRVTSMREPPLVILITAYGNVRTAVEAMKEGAYDYLTKPLDLDNAEMVIDRGLATRTLRSEHAQMRRELDRRDGLDGIIGVSPAMNRILETVRQVAPARSTILLSGESGTGKEVVAQAIHRLSPRSGRPFVVVHCASLNPNLLESELFGHEKGAYTGAHERQVGRFEMADSGTLFLDEIGEIDASTQIKLLRVLETRKFERVGGSQLIETDARVIAATNRQLKELVREGKFREDLYYRLNVVGIEIPPLRERQEDVVLLLDHFLKLSCAENGKNINGFSRDALKLLAAYPWPGNVRELRNCVERMVVMSRGSTLTVGDVPLDVQRALADSLDGDDQFADNRDVDAGGGVGAGHGKRGAGDRLNMESQEKKLIAQALEECDGNRTRAAERLGISRRTLHRKLNLYGLHA